MGDAGLIQAQAMHRQLKNAEAVGAGVNSVNQIRAIENANKGGGLAPEIAGPGAGISGVGGVTAMHQQVAMEKEKKLGSAKSIEDLLERNYITHSAY